MHNELTFERYLAQRKHSAKTIRSYSYAVKNFLALRPDAAKFSYRDVINFMSEKVAQTENKSAIAVELAAIKRYYDFLLETGVRQDHPCRSLNFKGTSRNRNVVHVDLFSSEELEKLLEREERYAALKLKNQALVSLLIYQGLIAQEIANMKTHHVDLDAGLIYVKESRMSSRRHLPILPRQYRILERYLRESRGELISVETDALLVGKLGTPITVDDIHYIISTYKPLFPDRNITPMIIRQSVIANWLNEASLALEQVQIMAGHRWISTTLKYRQSNHEQHRELINRWHPLG
jgi:site-specific recombinase XerD